MADNYNLDRFLSAQNRPGYGGYETAKRELQQGQNLSHWIWYIFPQLHILDSQSINGSMYGIKDINEAKAYLENPILRDRLEEVCEILLSHTKLSASDIFGYANSNRVRSSITLFYLASGNSLYKNVLDNLFAGIPCQKTLYALNMEMPSNNDRIVEKDPLKTAPARKKNNGVPPRENTSIPKKHRGNNKRKIKKIAIFCCACLLLVAVISGGIYYIYSLMNNKMDVPQTDTDEKFCVNVNIITNDQEELDAEALRKNAIILNATLGQVSVPIDSANCSYSFKYTGNNIDDTVDITAKIESCVIGEYHWSCSNVNGAKKDIKEYMTLNVRTVDLRIYEELAWYESAHRTVAEKKYPQYISRIKSVQDKSFADFLLAKLKSVNRSPEKYSKEKEAKKKAGKGPKADPKKSPIEKAKIDSKNSTAARSVISRIKHCRMMLHGRINPRYDYELQHIEMMVRSGEMSEGEAMKRIDMIEKRSRM